MLKKMKKAFTITELVIVIAVIAILAAVLIPTFTTVVDKANESAAMQEAKSEWTTCSAEIVTTVNASEMDYIIVRDGYAFVVEDGNFIVDSVQKGIAVDAKPNGVTTDAGTYTVGAQIYGFNKDGEEITTEDDASTGVYTFSSEFYVYALTIA